MLSAATTTLAVAAVYGALLVAVFLLFRSGAASHAAIPPALPPPPLALPRMEFELPEEAWGAGEPPLPEAAEEPKPASSLARLTDKLVAALESPAMRRPKLRELLAMSAPVLAGGSLRKGPPQPRREVEALRHAYADDGQGAGPTVLPATSGEPLREPPAEQLPMIEIGDGAFGSEEGMQAEGARAEGARALTAEERVLQMHIRPTGM
jgi:hypothetical protein